VSSSRRAVAPPAHELSRWQTFSCPELAEHRGPERNSNGVSGPDGLRDEVLGTRRLKATKPLRAKKFAIKRRYFLSSSSSAAICEACNILIVHRLVHSFGDQFLGHISESSTDFRHDAAGADDQSVPNKTLPISPRRRFLQTGMAAVHSISRGANRRLVSCGHRFGQVRPARWRRFGRRTPSGGAIDDLRLSGVRHFFHINQYALPAMFKRRAG